MELRSLSLGSQPMTDRSRRAHSTPSPCPPISPSVSITRWEVELVLVLDLLRDLEQLPPTLHAPWLLFLQVENERRGTKPYPVIKFCFSSVCSWFIIWLHDLEHERDGHPMKRGGGFPNYPAWRVPCSWISFHDRGSQNMVPGPPGLALPEKLLEIQISLSEKDPSPQNLWIRNSGWGPVVCVLTSPSGDSDLTSARTIALRHLEHVSKVTVNHH